MKIDACPSFPGTCEEALRFYHEVLGGELLPFMRYEGSPAHNQTPPEWLTKVMHGAIEVGDIHLMGPELPPEQFEKLQGVHRSVNVDRAEDAERIFEALGEGGHVTLPRQGVSGRTLRHAEGPLRRSLDGELFFGFRIGDEGGSVTVT